MSLRVHTYQEDGLWVAHCLEMDLIGTGTSPTEAKACLLEAICAQVSFAQFKNDPGLLLHPAPDHVVEAWERAREK